MKRRTETVGSRDGARKLYVQRLDVNESLRVIGMQVVWVVVLGIAARIAWQRGLRRYAAFGG